ncbi:T9SS type A sorting domain-containing protein [Fulvivirgaceae bacterium BMA12]|uniref:T9SS type A sorting domain-containing protein n=1 Tax=Agaribacillus aureus TaxID=3051825 RepID=A0ABT8KZC6_9BACT|nr:T9SS type A sorting domain-containing protein [Fulvivirgaceae bacterium BMA12]
MLITKFYYKVFIVSLLLFSSGVTFAQQSVARKWNEVLLNAIRVDYARPTVHARNLFHSAVAMYDVWAVYDPTAQTFFLGKSLGGFECPFDGIPASSDVGAARSEAISYAVYRILKHRFQNSPGAAESLPAFDDLMQDMGYDTQMESTDYAQGDPAALGNYLAEKIIEFGLQDGANEKFDYRNLYYTPLNVPMDPTKAGSQGLNEPNHWQPLAFDFFIDQAGFEVPGGIPDFLSPEWGKVIPFALTSDDLNIYERDGDDYWVYHDPGAPCYIQENGEGTASEYLWGHSLVAIWSAHLDPSDNVMMDISPASIGNIEHYPTTLEGLREFYDLLEGGDPGKGHEINPYTQQPYEPQIVPRADYARVLAEFWADGPDSETPPGHWFTILNYVNDHDLFEKKFMGEGAVLENLEWDVKAYFVLAGAVHDAAVTAWGIKGWYDYIRPVSAIRYMADRGQSSDPELPNYAPDGIPLEAGLIELVPEGDPLAGDMNENVNKIKLFAWKGPEYIADPETDMAGVGWILAENWWPYQRPSFVTPPFAGYISGHSTFSRAAAEVMTLLTGDEFFPGGIGEFVARKNEFLVFEEGPSMDITLQWATYRDASDQTSLSRIWGGIHPPVDDIPGRLIGEKIGISAFNFAKAYFDGTVITGVDEISFDEILVYPNPVKGSNLSVKLDRRFSSQPVSIILTDMRGRVVKREDTRLASNIGRMKLDQVTEGIYLLNVKVGDMDRTLKIVVEH